MQNRSVTYWLLPVLVALGMSGAWAAPPERLTLSLDGEWNIADSTSADAIPQAFTRTVPVPGLAHLATPGFADVDGFYSREHLANRIRAKLSPEDWLTNYWAGKINQDRIRPVHSQSSRPGKG